MLPALCRLPVPRLAGRVRHQHGHAPRPGGELRKRRPLHRAGDGRLDEVTDRGRVVTRLGPELETMKAAKVGGDEPAAVGKTEDHVLIVGAPVLDSPTTDLRPSPERLRLTSAMVDMYSVPVQHLGAEWHR